MRTLTKKPTAKITEVIKIDRRRPQRHVIERAARLIRSGEPVAFPTETVYGLGANGLDDAAVERIFIAKGRPQDNPLILHIGYKKDLSNYVLGITPSVRKLIRAFWPGPLTIILRKRKIVPMRVTAGLQTVAVRMPANTIALKLIRTARLPLAAPSANASGKPSPTRAEHVLEDLDEKIPMILDGGPTTIGLESTVLDCTLDPPVILRPGKISGKQIQKVLGTPLPVAAGKIPEYVFGRSPGMKYRHYAPKAMMILITGDRLNVREKIKTLAKKYGKQGKRIGILSFTYRYSYPASAGVTSVYLGRKSRVISKKLFESFREFDYCGVDVILCERYNGSMEAIYNRLLKAATVIISAGDSKYISE
jgi:L-threonylcarbamoyladenylate synthase